MKKETVGTHMNVLRLVVVALTLLVWSCATIPRISLNGSGSVFGSFVYSGTYNLFGPAFIVIRNTESGRYYVSANASDVLQLEKFAIFENLPPGSYRLVRIVLPCLPGTMGFNSENLFQDFSVGAGAVFLGEYNLTVDEGGSFFDQELLLGSVVPLDNADYKKELQGFQTKYPIASASLQIRDNSTLPITGQLWMFDEVHDAITLGKPVLK